MSEEPKEVAVDDREPMDPAEALENTFQLYRHAVLNELEEKAECRGITPPKVLFDEPRQPTLTAFKKELEEKGWKVDLLPKKGAGRFTVKHPTSDS